MCYRLYAAIHPSAGSSSDNATQGIFSFLELWIGVIVACMPTMAPIFVNYILPLATSIHSKLFGSGSSANDSFNMRHLRAAIDDPAVNTFHRSGPDSHKKRRIHSLPDDSTLAVGTYGHYGEDSGDLHVRLVSPPANAYLQTDCATAPDETTQSRDGIYVKQGFHTDWNEA